MQYIKLASAERGFGTETVRAPRQKIAGAERDRILNIIKAGIANRPGAKR